MIQEMTSEKKLTLTAASTVLVTMLFAYFTWSVNKWTSGIEGTAEKTWDVVQGHEPRLVKVEQQITHINESNADVKIAISKLDAKIDRLLDMVVGEKKDRAAK